MASCMGKSMNDTSYASILLAEDDDAMRAYLERALVQAGFRVDSVDRGTAALPLLENGRYDSAFVGHCDAGNGRNRAGAEMQ